MNEEQAIKVEPDYNLDAFEFQPENNDTFSFDQSKSFSTGSSLLEKQKKFESNKKLNPNINEFIPGSSIVPKTSIKEK